MDIPRAINNLIRWKYIGVILICVFYGCASVNATISDNLNIDRRDGINIKEAILIATSYVKEDEYYKKFYLVSKPTAKNSVLRENCWAVEFHPNLKGIFKVYYPLQISVDKNTGEIKGSGVTK